MNSVDLEPMELIIKPTQACNFACTFCSSTEISETSKTVLTHSHIFKFLERFPHTRTIIVNGGDPLVLQPEYYWKIIKYIEDHDLPAELSFTSNLWAFYKNPAKWKDLLSHPKVGVITSFQFGNSRKITKSRVFTLEDFLKISDLMLSEVGYRPDFISVIDESSIDTAIENVRLAKQLGVECKLNYAMASGRQSRPLLLHKIYKLYHQIWKEGLTEWEYNTKQVLDRNASGQSFACPRLKNCDQHIRAMNPEGDYYSCGSLADDRVYEIDWASEMLGQERARPLSHAPELVSMKMDCFSCEFFELCNGCKKTISDVKRFDLVEEHCSGMQVQKDILHEMGYRP